MSSVDPPRSDRHPRRSDDALVASRTHQLKTLYPWFTDVLDGRKTFEVRHDDRDYRVGDWLRLRGWDGSNYTGDECFRLVTYVLPGGRFGVQDGFVVLGLRTEA